MSEVVVERDDQARFWRRNNPFAWGVVFSVLVLAIAVSLAFRKDCYFAAGVEPYHCETKLDALLDAPFNEIGDTLAGFAGILAFLWIIITVILQGQELAEQRRVLLLQKEEMVEQRKATQDMARAMSAQADIFEDERKQRIELRNRDILVRRMERFVSYMESWERLIFIKASRGKYFSNVNTGEFVGGSDTELNYKILPDRFSGDTESLVNLYAIRLKEKHDKLTEIVNAGGVL